MKTIVAIVTVLVLATSALAHPTVSTTKKPDPCHASPCHVKGK